MQRQLRSVMSFLFEKADMVEDLCLDFILPGHQNLELMKGGKNKPVLGENLEQYIDLVAHWSMVEGVRRQFSALKCGFNELFDIKKLSLFLPWELPRLFCGSERVRWTVIFSHLCRFYKCKLTSLENFRLSIRSLNFILIFLRLLNLKELYVLTMATHRVVGRCNFYIQSYQN